MDDSAAAPSPAADDATTQTTSAPTLKRLPTRGASGEHSPAKRARHEPAASSTSASRAEVNQVAQGSGRPRVVRVRGLPGVAPVDAENMLRNAISQRLRESERQYAPNIAIVPACDHDTKLAALVDFPTGLPGFLAGLQDSPRSLEQLPLDGSQNTVSFDLHFHGFTQLYGTDSSQNITAE